MGAYIDPVNKATYPLTDKIWRSPTGGPLMLTPLEGIHRDKIDQNNRSIWRYRASFPLDIERPVSLGEAGRGFA